jgi:hypothetical protein
MRVWRAKLITDDNLREYSGAELTILAAEIEALRGKTFSEEWLQKYFDERYWYKRNPAYDPAVLTAVERKNIERLLAEKEKGRKTAISIGDMDNFQNVLLSEDKFAAYRSWSCEFSARNSTPAAERNLTLRAYEITLRGAIGTSR